MKSEPDAVLGHSFGGKVALTYLADCQKHSRKVPEQVWVLDALPGTSELASSPDTKKSSRDTLTCHPIVQNKGATDYAKRELTASIENILPKLKEIPLPIRNKKTLISDLQAKGVGLGEAQWLTTNLRLVSESPESYVWKMDVQVIEQLFESFLTTDLWPVVQNPPADVELHFVRAERSKMWSPQVVEKFEHLVSHAVHLHLLEKADHWVHIDNPTGLLDIIQANFNP